MAAKKHRPIKSPLYLITGIIILTISAFLIFRIMKPTQVVAPAEIPAPTNVAQNLNGIYKGDLPCADCTGISETLILAADGSYILEDVYQGKSVKPFQTQGKWELNGNILKLTPKEGPNIQYFQTGENSLTMLDNNQQKIESPFNQTLTKQY